jgi:hypothetical protein
MRKASHSPWLPCKNKATAAAIAFDQIVISLS